MKTRVQVLLLGFGLLLGRLAAGANLDSIGDVHFPATATPQALEHFTAGLAYLHSFGWKQARTEFRRAQALQPGFAMAYWGEAMSYNNPLAAEADTGTPRTVLEQLGGSPAERLNRAPTALEKGFLRSAEAYVFTPGDARQRRIAWRDAMEDLYVAFPGEQEVRAFYALSLLSVAMDSDQEQARALRQRAARIARGLFAENLRHPGAVHYLIHASADAQAAPGVLDAAERYVEIAPRVSHARHMPTHIYLYLGDWHHVAELNESAYYTAKALWEPGDDPSEQNHILEWGQYGDLQLANYDEAGVWIGRAEDTLQQNPGNPGTALVLGRMRARYIIESQQWQALPVSAASADDELLAAGLSAITLRDLSLASAANQILKQRASLYPANLSLQLTWLALDGAILFAAGDETSGSEVLRRAIALADADANRPALPMPLKPLQELYGELLLRSGQPRLAAQQFAESLLRYPHRPLSLLGQARSYVEMGQPDKATPLYRELVSTWEDRQFIGASEAKTHLSLYDKTETSQVGDQDH